MTTPSNQTFCTIISANYIHYALTLYQSLLKFNPNISLNIFTTDNKEALAKRVAQFSSLSVYGVSDLCEDGLGKALYNKYYESHLSEFRWSMKSVFMKFLMKKKGYNKVIWADADLFFVGDYQFLFDMLDKYNIILTPHWRNSNPFKEQKNFDLLFVAGLYNAGFYAVHKNAIDALVWCSKANLYKCEGDFTKGRYYDQTYLNLLPIYFDKVKILQHRGCNIAEWNREECKRTLDEHGNLLINHKWQPVFIHFTDYAIRGSFTAQDPLLRSYAEEWYQLMKIYKSDYELPFPKETKWKKTKKEIKKILNLGNK